MKLLLVIAGIAVLAHALRTFTHPLPRKLGALLYLVASYVAGWGLAGSHVAGIAAVAAWFFLPWVEIVLRVRKLRLPLEKSLRHRMAPNSYDFPQLGEFTEELEQEGFEQTDDAGFDWDDVRQFLRVCFHAPSKTQAVIHLNQQSNLSVAFVSVTCRTSDGRVVTTTNYPFSVTMQAPPNLLLHRVPGVGSFSELLTEHRATMAELSIGEEDLVSPEPDALAEQLQTELDVQVRHNLQRGFIVKSGDGLFRYSWRGCVYLWAQLVKDMVRFA